MEMMIVLLIMSIIAAATAPIVSKSASSSNSNPWVFIDTKGNAAFNMAGKDVTAVIGASKVPTGVNTRLYIDCGNSNSQLTFGKGDEVMQVTADPSGRVGISNATIPAHSVAIGGNQTITCDESVTIGQNAVTKNLYATAIGQSAVSVGSYGIAIGAYAETGAAYAPLAAGYHANASEPQAVAIGPHSKANGSGSVALGGAYNDVGGKATQATGSHAIALGAGASAGGDNSVALGENTTATGQEGIAIGSSAEATGNKSGTGGSIALGKSAKAQHKDSIAIGRNAVAQKEDSIAIGQTARALHDGSTAIGQGAVTTQNSQIALGRTQDTVYIRGNLVVDGHVLLNRNGGTKFYVREGDGSKGLSMFAYAESDGKRWRGSSMHGTIYVGGLPATGFVRALDGTNSDRRLKNVGEKFVAGLDALKKLDLYHYTYKNDETSTPHVGVMAQDLQKVFPNAVTKGEDGYLKIRMEDMFFALINAVKELDFRYAKMKNTIDEQQKTIDELKKEVETIKSQNAELVKLLKK